MLNIFIPQEHLGSSCVCYYLVSDTYCWMMGVFLCDVLGLGISVYERKSSKRLDYKYSSAAYVGLRWSPDIITYSLNRWQYRKSHIISSLLLVKMLLYVLPSKRSLNEKGK